MNLIETWYTYILKPWENCKISYDSIFKFKTEILFKNENNWSLLAPVNTFSVASKENI
jgi:hypothetical protein